jgi:hypothetical protein
MQPIRPTFRLATLESILTLAVLAAALPDTARAQSLWLDRLRPNTVLLEIVKPDLQGPDDASFTTSAWYLSGRKEFSPSLHGVAEIPFGTSGVSEGEAFGTGAMLGNPYLGIEAGSPYVWAELGLRLPLAGDNFSTASIGVLSDTERWPAWLDEAATVRVGMRACTAPTDGGFRLEARLAPEFWIGTEPSWFEESTVWLTYGAILRFDLPAVRGGAGLSGRAHFLDATHLTQGVGQADLGADFGTGRVRPGVSLRIPIGSDLDRAVALIYGLSVTYVP